MQRIKYQNISINLRNETLIIVNDVICNLVFSINIYCEESESLSSTCLVTYGHKELAAHHLVVSILDTASIHFQGTLFQPLHFHHCMF